MFFNNDKLITNGLGKGRCLLFVVVVVVVVVFSDTLLACHKHMHLPLHPIHAISFQELRNCSTCTHLLQLDAVTVLQNQDWILHQVLCQNAQYF